MLLRTGIFIIANQRNVSCNEFSVFIVFADSISNTVNHFNLNFVNYITVFIVHISFVFERVGAIVSALVVAGGSVTVISTVVLSVTIVVSAIDSVTVSDDSSADAVEVISAFGVTAVVLSVIAVVSSFD